MTDGGFPTHYGSASSSCFLRLYLIRLAVIAMLWNREKQWMPYSLFCEPVLNGSLYQHTALFLAAPLMAGFSAGWTPEYSMSSGK